MTRTFLCILVAISPVSALGQQALSESAALVGDAGSSRTESVSTSSDQDEIVEGHEHVAWEDLIEPDSSESEPDEGVDEGAFESTTPESTELESAATEEPAQPADPPWTFRLGDFLFRPSGEARSRLEARVGWFDRPGDRYLVTTRVRLGLDVRWNGARVLIELQDARDMGLTPGVSSSESTGVFQGFFELGGSTSFLRIGRQAIDLGTARLIGSLNWASAARSFDAIRARAVFGPLVVDSFVAITSMPRRVVSEGLATDSEGNYVAALTLEWIDGPTLRLGMDCLYRHDGPLEADLGRRRDVGAFTLRADGDVEAIRYIVELIGEFGAQSNNQAILAFAAIGELYARLSQALKVGLGLTYGTGASPDGTPSELDNFYPSNHQIYGLADLFGLRNQAQAFVTVIATPEERWSASVAARAFALPEPHARWSNAPGQTVGLAPENDEGYVGTEFDLELRWNVMTGVDLWSGYALFVPAQGGVALGRTEPMHFAYVMLGAQFPR